MDAWRYGIYLLVFTLEDKFHISARPCIILYLVYRAINLLIHLTKK